MARTHEKVRYTPKSKPEKLTPVTAAQGVENVLKILEGRWKLVILFHLFGGKVLRFSDLERAIPAISQKMLIQQLRRMETDGVIQRILHPQVPPKVEYRLTPWGQKLCPALDALLKWAALRDQMLDDGARREFAGICLFRQSITFRRRGRSGRQAWPRPCPWPRTPRRPLVAHYP